MLQLKVVTACRLGLSQSENRRFVSDLFTTFSSDDPHWFRFVFCKKTETVASGQFCSLTLKGTWMKRACSNKSDLQVKKKKNCFSSQVTNVH